MSFCDFQYLDNPFSRDQGYCGEFREDVSFPPPTKPYFNGVNAIQDSHPSVPIRKCIYDHLKQTTVPKADYSGNKEGSKLHELEKENQEVLQSFRSGELVSKTGQVVVNDDDTIESNGEWTSQFEEIKSILIPENCGFYNGDVLSFLESKELEVKFDIIEIDPPWPSKSVQHAKIYSDRHRDFSTIESMFTGFDPDELCQDGCYILVWITNNPKCMETVLHFFQEKRITHITTAYWVKVTREGSPLVPFSCAGRETFERVVIGRYWNQPNELESKRRKVDSTLSSDLYSFSHEVKQLSGIRTGVSCEICDHLCDVKRVPFIVSPVSFHSRKPNCELFHCIQLPSSYRGLELFARQLRPRWYSVGNEVLLFQNCKLFKNGLSDDQDQAKEFGP